MANIGSMKARLLVQVGNEPVELGEFEIPLTTAAAFGTGLGSIHVDETEMRNSLATALELGAKNLRSK